MVVTLENYETHLQGCTFGLKTCPEVNCQRQYKASGEDAHQLEHANEKIAEVKLHFFD